MRRQYRDGGYHPRSEVHGHQTHLFKKTVDNAGAPGDACAEGEMIENRCFSLLLFCGLELRNQTVFFFKISCVFQTQLFSTCFRTFSVVAIVLIFLHPLWLP